MKSENYKENFIPIKTINDEIYLNLNEVAFIAKAMDKSTGMILIDRCLIVLKSGINIEALKSYSELIKEI